MADTSSAATAASDPSAQDRSRVEEFTREPVLHEGETVEDALAPGSPRRRAFDAALAELERGEELPSTEWRRQYSLLLRPPRPAFAKESPPPPRPPPPAPPRRWHAALGPPGRCARRHADRAERRGRAQRQRERERQRRGRAGHRRAGRGRHPR